MKPRSIMPLLYKYATLRSTHAESLLSTPSLWFATAPSLNDPFELRPVHTVNGRQLPADLSADFNEAVLDHAGICCLSRINDSVLMWSHYADSHAGFCLGFDAEGLSRVADLVLPVQYQSSFPALEFFGVDLDHIDRGVSLQHMTTKFEGWAYEEEVRLLSLSRKFYREMPGYKHVGRRGPGPHPYPADLLRAITFGLRMPPGDRTRVRALVEKRGHPVEFYECAIAPDAFKISIVRIA